VSVRACSTCANWEPTEYAPDLFGVCRLAKEHCAGWDVDPKAVMLVDEHAGHRTRLMTRCDFNCGWWEEKS
jgi:hypothetical protein